MSNIVLLAVAVVITFVGCAILFVDVIATKKTDLCQDETPAEYVGEDLTGRAGSCGKSGLFVLASPEFRYEYEGKAYQGKSANVFFHPYLKAGKRGSPFLRGKTYLIFVNPVQPSLYVTSGEQRFAFLHVMGCVVSVVGILLLMFAMGFFA